MTIAFFSDVHGNLPALEAVLADMDRRRPDMIFCLGDLVGYAPWPNEVVNEVRRRGIPTLAGNYDQGIGLASENCGCAYKTDTEKDLGAQSIAFTNQVVGADERRYLRYLPKHMRLDFQEEPCTLSLLMVHGSPRKINEYLFEDRPEASFLRVLQEAQADILLFGHTHKPYHRTFAYEHAGETRYRHALNIGSVGKPKDGDPRAAYQLLHLDEHTILTDPGSVRSELVRVEYDVEKAALAVEASPLPNEYADMLRKAY
ncbi:putative phosphodiesterase [Hymenobacter luteus]|uniref:Phosphodiesterase n=2 Tax=Hymenobacter TaxID=89966 RepID=A0ABR6K4P6_9BACT|nr:MULTISPECIES: metallophosphoesterase family protein [Hymenobacter]MBB4603570.1 putative phosphodiesterase [Hymenobacter latericoloratus]MBB6061257.1 putative phosphodiesterase [Hymenobacter luteus]MCC3160144.1 metallophosphatase family protein [Hymenobacter sp. 15J16-1T3B]